MPVSGMGSPAHCTLPPSNDASAPAPILDQSNLLDDWNSSIGDAWFGDLGDLAAADLRATAASGDPSSRITAQQVSMARSFPAPAPSDWIGMARSCVVCDESGSRGARGNVCVDLERL